MLPRSRKSMCNKEDTMKLIQAVKENGCIWNPSDEFHKERFHIALTWKNIAEKLGKNERLLRSKWRNLRDTFIKEVKKYKCNNNLESYKGSWCFFKQIFFLRQSVNIKMDNKQMETDDNNYEEDDSSQSNESSDGVNDNENNDNDENTYLSDIKREVEEVEQVDIEFQEADDALASPEPSPKKIRKNYIEIKEANDILSLPEPCSKKRRNNDSQFLYLDSSNSESKDSDFDEMFLKSLTPYFRQLDPLRKLVLRSRIQDMLMNEIAAQKGKTNKC